MVRNPRTGERKRAKATAVPRFRAGSDLKAYVSGAKKLPKAGAKKASTAVKTPAAIATVKSAAKKSSATKATAKKSTAANATAKASAKSTAAAKKSSTRNSASKKSAAGR
jgi:DNA-binding protein HU-beta